MYFCKAQDGVSQYAVSTPRSWNDSFGEVLTGNGNGKGRGLQAPPQITFDSYDSDEDSSSSSDGDADCESECDASRPLESLCSSSSSTTMVLEGACYELQARFSNGISSSSNLKSSNNKFLISPAATEAMSESDSDCDIARDLNALRRRLQHSQQYVTQPQQYAISH
jgi:hypothetical protein